MAVTIDPDLRRAASHENMIEHLTAPLAAGAGDTVVPVAATAQATVDWRARHPLLLAAPSQPLEGSGLLLRATVPASGGGTTTVDLEFAPYTETGAFLPVFLAPVDTTDLAMPFSVALALEEIAPDGTKTAVPAAEVRERIELRVLEGLLARTLYLLGAEKGRLRREGREISAARLLARARDSALDRLGAELAVPRFADRLEFKNNAIVSEIAREPDDDYRRRLRLYDRMFLRSYPEILQLLNGPGQEKDANAGAIGELAVRVPANKRAPFQKRFRLVDRDNEFAVAIHVVAAGDAAYRQNFFDFVRAVHLIWPGTTQAATDAHGKRFLPRQRREREERLRSDLRQLFDFGSFEAGSEAALAPMLAAAMIRAARCIQALGGPSPWPLFRAQRGDRGSRYELGLGVDAKRLTAAELTAMSTRHAALRNQDPEFNQIPDPDPTTPAVKAEVRALLKSMTPASSAGDPDGRWLLEPCGLRTVHRLPGEAGEPWPRTYLSHFPTFGLTISEDPPAPAVGVEGWTELASVRFGQASAIATYEREKGAAQLWTTSHGTLIGQEPQTAVGTAWTHVAAANFSESRSDDVLLYDRPAATVAIHRTSGDGIEAAAIASATNIGSNWTHVVPVAYGDSPARVLFYDSKSGDLAIYEVALTAAIAPTLTLVKLTPAWRKGWSEVVPLETVSGSGFRATFADVFFYDREAGEGAIYTPDEVGDLSFRTGTRLRTTWTHVVPGSFEPAGGNAGLLFYDRTAGEVEVYDGDLELVAAQSGLPKSWSELVPGRFVRPRHTDLFVYERLTGRGEFWLVDDGGLLLFRGSNTFPKSRAQTLEANFHAPGDPGTNAVLADALASALARWTAAGQPPWTELGITQARQRWDQAQTLPASDPASKAFKKAGLPAVGDPPAVVAKLKGIAPEFVATIDLAPAQAQAITTDAPGAAEALRDLAGLLADERLTSVLPLVTGPSQVVLVVGVVPLPVAGTNLFEQPGTSFRWYVVPLQGQGGAIRPLGKRTQFAPAEEGVYAIVALAYARRRLTDPYEYRVELPPDGLLTLQQYEYLMNLLEHACPAGVRVNTYSIRRQHVSLKVNGEAQPLDPTISRTYRAFRRPRHRGETSVTLESE